jgi:hypothetical protein
MKCNSSDMLCIQRKYSKSLPFMFIFLKKSENDETMISG